MTTDTELLRILWPDGLPTGHYLNTFTLPDKASRFHDHIPTQEQFSNLGYDIGCDVYFGVGLGVEPKGVRVRYTQRDIHCLPAVFVDVDIKASNTQEKALGFCSSFSLRPTAIVHTGGGYHAYWALRQPLLGQEPIAELLAGWKGYVSARATECGVQVDTQVIEPARILRLDGFVNYKPGRKMAAVQIVSRSHARYAVTEIPTRSGGQEARRTFDEVVPDGFRNDSMFSFACYVRSKFGANEAQLERLCATFNQEFVSPRLDEREVKLIARSATRYAIR